MSAHSLLSRLEEPKKGLVDGLAANVFQLVESLQLGLNECL
jgi:hypothetical protein